MAVIRVGRSDGVSFSIDFEDVGEVTRQFVGERLEAAFSGERLVDLVGELLKCMGYHVRWFIRTGVDGLDLVATTDPLGLGPRRAKVQVRPSRDPIDKDDLRRFADSLGADDRGVVVALEGFTRDAAAYAHAVGVQLLESRNLIDLILRHYEQLDASTRALIPLKTALVPMAIATQLPDCEGVAAVEQEPA